MEIKVKKYKDENQLYGFNCEKMKELVKKCDESEVIFDFKTIKIVSSSIISVLATALKEKKKVKITNASDELKTLLSIMKLDRLIKIE